MYQASELKVIHLELTTRCNASCPMCPRTLNGAAHPALPLSSLGLSDIQKMLPKDLLQPLKKLYLCGNFGDPAAAPECLEIVRYLRAQNPSLRLELHTNGGLRSAAWWRALAGCIDLCHFGIDGLEDTNHLYRQGVTWSTLMRNVEAFLSAGGVAHWVYLVFAHNEHQVEEARRRSQQLGFQRFVVKSTARFYHSATNEQRSAFAVKNQAGVTTHLLSPANAPQHQNPSVEAQKRLVAHFGTMEAYLERCEVRCKAQEEKSLYIDADGLAFPCCWVAAERSPTQPGPTQLRAFVETLPGKEEALSLQRRPLFEILGDPFFTTFSERWRPGPLTERWRVCAKMCGTQFRPFEGQFLQK